MSTVQQHGIKQRKEANNDNKVVDQINLSQITATPSVPLGSPIAALIEVILPLLPPQNTLLLMHFP